MGLTEALQEAGLGDAFVTFLVSMVPVIELRGAIPIGVSLGMSPWAAYAVSVVGNIIPVPFIIAFIRVIFSWLRKRSSFFEELVTKLERKAHSKWNKANRYRFEFLALMIFVAIPLPGTGAWSGALIAAMADMRMSHALPAIALGVIIAGFAILGLTYGVAGLFS